MGKGKLIRFPSAYVDEWKRESVEVTSIAT